MCGERIHLIGSISLSSPPVAGVWWAQTLDWLYDSLSSPPVAGVWWAQTLDWLYDSLSSPPVAGVWWAHTLDWLSDFLSSPPVAGVWWDPPPPPTIVKRFGCTAIHNKALYKCFIHFHQSLAREMNHPFLRKYYFKITVEAWFSEAGCSYHRFIHPFAYE